MVLLRLIVECYHAGETREDAEYNRLSNAISNNIQTFKKNGDYILLFHLFFNLLVSFS